MPRSIWWRLTTESEDEGPLAKVGKQRNTGIQRMGIELSPLNMALVEVHRQLHRVSVGAKDMAINYRRPNYRRPKSVFGS